MVELLNPLLFTAGAAAAVAVPLILHLIQSRRTIRLPFSTVRFLQLAQRRSSQRIRMENWILWLLRTLLLLALALAFGMPMLRNRAAGTWLGRASRDVALIVDASYSMTYNLGRETVWERSIAQAITVLEGLGEQDRFCLFIAQDRVIPLIEQLSTDREEGIRRLRSLSCSEMPGSLAPALAAAWKTLNDSGTGREREIHLITDGQSFAWDDLTEEGRSTEDPSSGGANAGPSGWKGSDVDDRTTCFISILGAPTPENRMPVSIRLEPALMVEGAAGKLSATIGRTGPATESAVTLWIDEKEVATRSVGLDAAEQPEVTFLIPPLAKGPHAGRLVLPSDPLTLDNTYHFLIRVEDRVPVLAIGRGPDLLYLKAALSAGGGASSLRADFVDPQELARVDLAQYRGLFLCNAIPLSADEVRAIESFVQSGGLLAIFPGDRAGAADYGAWSSLPAKPGAPSELSPAQRKQPLVWRSAQHPILRTLDPGTAPPYVTAQRYLPLALASGATLLLSHGGEHPLLVGMDVGQGYALISSLPADRTWSDFPLSPYFLPLIHQIVRYAAGVHGVPPSVECTPMLPIQPHVPRATEGLVLEGPNGARATVRGAREGTTTTLHLEELYRSGMYQAKLAGAAAVSPVLAVNVDRRESQLEPIEPESMRARIGMKQVEIATDRESLLAVIDSSRIGRTFGEHLLWLAWLLALIEFAYAAYLTRATPALSDHLTIESSGKVQDQTASPSDIKPS